MFTDHYEENEITPKLSVQLEQMKAERNNLALTRSTVEMRPLIQQEQEENKTKPSSKQQKVVNTTPPIANKSVSRTRKKPQLLMRDKAVKKDQSVQKLLQKQWKRKRCLHLKQKNERSKVKMTSEILLMGEIQDLENQLSQYRWHKIRLMRKCKQPVKHIVMITNRLPIQVVKQEDGSYTFPRQLFSPPSGVATAFSSTMSSMRYSISWVGWPGQHFHEDEQLQVTEQLKKKNMIPVFLDKKDSKLYYVGFSRKILWHLFHYRALDVETLKSAREEWDAYNRVNQRFAQVALEHSNEHSLFWVHDYQLLLVPYFLRGQQRSAQIGLYLHCPFPSSEMYRVLPFRIPILQGMLSSNFIGFQTMAYERNFVEACKQVLKCNEIQQTDFKTRRNKTTIGDCGRRTTCGVVPMGIDPEFWLNCLNSEDVKKRHAMLAESFKDQVVILGVDRLDHMKGLPNKLYAIDTFFEDNPEWIGKVVFIQIAVPNPMQNEEQCEELQTLVHKLVGEINGKYGTLLSVPIHYLDQALSDIYICALYKLAHVCLLSSIRDGMNLVSYEFICAQNVRDPGVLILSEFTGSSRLLYFGCITVNPWDVREMANAVLRAIEMPLWERKALHSRVYEFVTVKQTAQVWAQTCVEEIESAWMFANRDNSIVPQKLDIAACLKSWHNASRRVLFFGFKECLWSSGSRNRTFRNTRSCLEHTEMDNDLLDALENLQNDPRTTVIIITDQEKKVCDRFLKNTDVWQIAENGFYLKKGLNQKWEKIVDYTPSELFWIDDTEAIMRKYAANMEKAWVQRNETVVSFFYEDCMNLIEADNAIEARVVMMKKEIRSVIHRHKAARANVKDHKNCRHSKNRKLSNIAIEQYGKQILVRQHQRKKRAVIEVCLNGVLDEVHTRVKGNPEFVLCYGNFREDEDLFLRFEELNFRVNEIRKEQKMSPSIHAEIEYPEIKYKFLNGSGTKKDKYFRKKYPRSSVFHPAGAEGEGFSPEGATFLFPHPIEDKLDAKCDSPAESTPPARQIAELDWSANTEVWTVCSQRRPTHARYYLLDSKRAELFNFLVKMDQDPKDPNRDKTPDLKYLMRMCSCETIGSVASAPDFGTAFPNCTSTVSSADSVNMSDSCLLPSKRPTSFSPSLTKTVFSQTPPPRKLNG
jgi:alpha,alpha-trehalose-phosphate synthase [UDP-forming]